MNELAACLTCCGKASVGVAIDVRKQGERLWNTRGLDRSGIESFCTCREGRVRRTSQYAWRKGLCGASVDSHSCSVLPCLECLCSQWEFLVQGLVRGKLSDLMLPCANGIILGSGVALIVYGNLVYRIH